jgi:hypothetical protein
MKGLLIDDADELGALDCDALLDWARRAWSPERWAVLTVTPEREP